MQALPSAASREIAPDPVASGTVPDDGTHHLYMYAILRGDLEMPSGKGAAQAGHAFTEALYAAIDVSPEAAFRYGRERGSKVVLVAKGLRDLERAHEQARAAGLPCALFTDEHHVLPPHFDGSPVVTALGIGPCTREEARHATKRFKLLRDADGPDPDLRKAFQALLVACRRETRSRIDAARISQGIVGFGRRGRVVLRGMRRAAAGKG